MSFAAVFFAPGAAHATKVADGTRKAVESAVKLIDGAVRSGERERGHRMVKSLQEEHPDATLGDHERVLIAQAFFRVGQLGDVGRMLQRVVGKDDAVLRPFDPDARQVDLQARVAATVMLGHVDAGAELLRRCREAPAGQPRCGTFQTASIINRFQRGPLARQLLDTFAPTQGTPAASYYISRVDSELHKSVANADVALGWARAGLLRHKRDHGLLSAAAHAALVADRWDAVFAYLLAISAVRPQDNTMFAEFTRRTGISAVASDPQRAEQPAPVDATPADTPPYADLVVAALFALAAAVWWRSRSRR